MDNSLARYLPDGVVPGIALGMPDSPSSSSWYGVLGLDSMARRRGHAMLVAPCSPAGQPLDAFRLPAPLRSKLLSTILRTPCLVWLLRTEDFSALPARLRETGLRYLPDNVAIVGHCYDQASCDEMAPALCAVEATWRVLAIRRPLGSFDLRLDRHAGISQITVTGGGLLRSIPLHPLWLTDWMTQASGAGIPLDFQSWGMYAPITECRPNPRTPLIHYLPNGRVGAHVADPATDPRWIGARIGPGRSGCRYQGSEHHGQADYDLVYRRVIAPLPLSHEVRS